MRQLQKTRKPDQKTTFFGLRGRGGGGGGAMKLKSRDIQKAHIGPLLNIHMRFQLPLAPFGGEIGQ